jgi:hypothetical protein
VRLVASRVCLRRGSDVQRLDRGDFDGDLDRDLRLLDSAPDIRVKFLIPDSGFLCFRSRVSAPLDPARLSYRSHARWLDDLRRPPTLR